MNRNPLARCRVCLNYSTECIELDTPFETDEFDVETTFTYLDCFRLCTRLEAYHDMDDDNNPLKLCESCGVELKIAYDFLKRAERSDKILQRIRENLEETVKVNAGEEEFTYVIEGFREDADDSSGKKCLQNANNHDGPEDVNIVYQCSFCDETFLSQFVLNLHLVNHREHTKESPKIKSDTSVQGSSIHTDEDDYVEMEIAESGSEDNEYSEFVEEPADVEDQTQDSVFFEVAEDKSLSPEEADAANSENADNEDATETSINSTSVAVCDTARTYRCWECAIDFVSRNEFILHRRRVHKMLSTCKICKIQINETDSVREHNKRMHSHVVECTKCDFKCKEFKLAEHERRVHTRNREYGCHVCSHTFATCGLLNAHLKYHLRKEESPKSDACEQCGKQFSTKHYLRLHMAVHQSDRSLHHCPDCDKVYVSKPALENHMRIHQGDTVQCFECGKNFPRKYELEVHMRFHTRDYPFECEVCGKRYAIKGHLRTHMWRHQGLKLQCEECGKLFTSAKALQEHSYTHTQMPFPCSYCSKAYPSKQKYKVHLRSIHMIELNAEELKKLPKDNTPKPLKRKKLTLVQADTFVKEIEVKSRDDSSIADEPEVVVMDEY